jgi:hypothetical protein
MHCWRWCGCWTATRIVAAQWRGWRLLSLMTE